MAFKTLSDEKHKLIVKIGACDAKMRNSKFPNKNTKLRSLPRDFWIYDITSEHKLKI